MSPWELMGDRREGGTGQADVERLSVKTFFLFITATGDP